MLPLLKNKILYLSLDNKKCAWLSPIKSGDYELGEFSIDELESQIMYLIKKNKYLDSVDITFESDLCRFIVVPALKVWPEEEAINFMIQHRFQNKYPDFHINDFIILHEQIKFNQPLMVVAYPKNIYQKILVLQSKIKIKSLIPSILGIWNYYENKLKNSIFMIEENSLIYLLRYNKGIIQDINVFPNHLKHALNYEDHFSFTLLKSIEGENINLSLNLSPWWNMRKNKSYGEVLNFMRLYTRG